MIKLSKPSGLELLRLRRHADSLLTFLKRGKKKLVMSSDIYCKVFKEIYKVNYNEYKYFKFILIKNYS